MKDLLRVVRFAVYVFALPFIATAAVSAHQYYLENMPIKAPAIVGDAASPTMVSGLTGSFRNHTLTVDDRGQASGRIVRVNSDLSVVGLSAMKVLFVLNGAIVHEVFTDLQGGFVVSGLTEGIYSFVTVGNEGFATCGVKVSKGEIDQTNNRLEIAVVNPDYMRVRESFYAENINPSEVLAENDDLPQQIAGANLVALDGGKLNGRLFNFLPRVFPENTNAYLIRHDSVVAVTSVDRKGNFSFADIEPGTYEFVAASRGGFAAVSFEAVVENQVELPGPLESSPGNFSIDDVEPETVQTVSVLENIPSSRAESVPIAFVAATSLDVALTNPADRAIVLAQLDRPIEVVEVEYIVNEIGCGTTSGAGGFGGVGDIAKLAILGWILTELFDDDDDPVIPPASPSR